MTTPLTNDTPAGVFVESQSNGDVARLEHSRVLTLVFTDLVESVALKRRLGDASASRLIAEHTSRLRALTFQTGGREIFAAGDGFFITFEAPSAAVEFALQLQRTHLDSRELPQLRIGIHMGEVTELSPHDGRRIEVEGLAVDIASRIQSLALPGQILLSYSVFDNARQRMESARLLDPIAWRAHGRYVFKGIEGGLEIYEAGFPGQSPLIAPMATDKAHPEPTGDGDSILGWRPAQGLEIPARPNWVLTDKLGTGGFGDVWAAEHRKTRERRVFKFCFSTDRLRTLKREVTLFRVLKEALGDRADIARVLDYQFEEPPFFLELEYSGGGNLADWAESHGGLNVIPLETRLQVVAGVAEALAAAHGVGVLHKDVKPSNVLVAETAGPPQIKMIDFGIGAIASRDVLENRGITASGLTEFMEPLNAHSVSGTQLYIAPELLAGKPATVWSDIYSLGVVLYQVVVGDLGRPIATGWQRHVQDDLLEKDIAACVDGDPANRLTSARELAERLRTRGARLQQRERQRQQEIAFERAQARHRLYRMTGLISAILITTAIAVGYMQYKRVLEEEDLRKQAQTARREALQMKTQADTARRAAEKAQYISAVGFAAASLREGRLAKVRELLFNQMSEDYRQLEWGWLYAQTARETFALSGLNIYDTAFAPDGSVFATGDRDNLTLGKGWVTIYDSRTGKRLRGEQVHERLIWDLEFSPDGKWLATASIDNTAAIIDTQTLKVQTRLKGHTGILRSVNFDADGKRVLTAARDGSMRIWDTQSGAELKQMLLPDEQFCECFFTRSGKSVVSTALGGKVRLWDVATAAPRVAFTGHTDSVLSACFGPGGETLITACKDGKVRIFPVSESGSTSEVAALREFVTEDTWPQAVRMIPNLGLLAVACDNGKYEAYDLQSGASKFSVQSEGPAWKVEPSPDGAFTLLTTRWSVENFRNADLQDKQQVRATRAAEQLSSDTIRVVANGSAGVRDTTWKMDKAWRVPEGRTLVDTQGLEVAVDSFRSVFSPDNACRIIINDQTLSATVVSTTDGTTITQLGDMAVGEASFNQQGTLAVTIGAFQLSEVWDTKTWKLLRRLDRGSDYCCCHAFDPSGSRVAIGYADGSIILWDCATGKQMRTYRGSAYRALDVAFSDNGRYLGGGYASDRAKVFDVQNGDQISTLSGHVRYVHDVCFSPDSNRVLTLARDGTAKLWDVQSGQELLNIFETKNKPELVAGFFANDGRHVGVVTSNKRVLVSEYFPWQTQALPGTSDDPLHQRLELLKRRVRIDAKLTMADVDTR